MYLCNPWGSRDPDLPRFYLAYSAIPRNLNANSAIPQRPRSIRVPVGSEELLNSLAVERPGEFVGEQGSPAPALQIFSRCTGGALIRNPSGDITHETLLFIVP